MQGGSFPASAANSLIQGYCEDFVSFAAVLAQTLEQVSMRGLDLQGSRGDLERIENGMRNLADAIQELLARTPVKGGKGRSVDANGAPAASSVQQQQQQQQTTTTTQATGSKATTATNKQPAGPLPAPAPMPAPAANKSNAAASAKPAAPTPPPAPSATATPGNNGPVRVDMRPRDLGPDSPAADAAPRATKPAAPTPAPAQAPAAAAPAAKAPAAPAPVAAQPPAPQPPANPAAPAAAATGASRPVRSAPANRAKAAAPGSQPRPAAPTNNPAARITQRREAKPEGLKGTSRSMPLLSVMQFLGRMRKRGTMKVQLPGELITFELENGCVMATTTDRCPKDERLGDILVDMDVCSREQLEPLELLVEAGAPERFGQLAIQHGLADDAQVVAALEAQVKARFSRACKHQESVYEFAEGQRSSEESPFRIQPLSIA